MTQEGQGTFIGVPTVGTYIDKICAEIIIISEFMFLYINDNVYACQAIVKNSIRHIENFMV